MPTTALIDQARGVLPALEAYLEPAEPEWISARVIGLLAHYWLPDLGEIAAAAVLRDWFTLLGNLPPHAIDAACHDWLREHTQRRPGPGDILARAEPYVRKERAQRKRIVMLIAQASAGVGAGRRGRRG